MEKETIAGESTEKARIVSKETTTKMAINGDVAVVLAVEGEKYKHTTIDPLDGQRRTHEGVVPIEHVYIEIQG